MSARDVCIPFVLLSALELAACKQAGTLPDGSSSATTAAPPPATDAGASPAARASASAAPTPVDAGATDDVALDIVYVPTPQKVVDKMLEVAKVTKDDVVYDLGCGDGRIVVSAAKKFGARGLGFDLDPARIDEANANVKGANVGSLVTIQRENVFAVDLSPAPQFVNAEGYSAWKGADVPEDKKNYKERAHEIYLWTIPLKRAKRVGDAGADAARP